MSILKVKLRQLPALPYIFISQVSQLMDRFEQQFENLDVQSQVMENTMCNSSTLSTPQGQVDGLMQEVADEAGYVYINTLCVSDRHNHHQRRSC